MSGPVAVGVDLVEVSRIRAAIDRTPGLAERTFTPAEIEYCRRAREPWERFAARWAAKEATLKCLGGGVPGVDLRTIEVTHDGEGAPLLVVTGEAARRATERGVGGWLVSLTHVATHAQAVVIALGAG